MHTRIAFAMPFGSRGTEMETNVRLITSRFIATRILAFIAFAHE